MAKLRNFEYYGFPEQKEFQGIKTQYSIKNDEQDTEITYFFGQELTNTKTSLEEYMEKIQKVSKEDIIKVANSVIINTVYFLRDFEK